MAKLENLIGQTLDGKYYLDRLLGQGGMGAVFLATHLGTTRPVALKVIAPQFMTNEEVGERFRREAEAAGRLRHPNVVNVTDFGVASVGNDTLAYLVMEYLDGGSLGEMIKQRGAMPLPLIVDIVEQICLAIGNAHQQGIIHRDLKPDNILLQPNQRGGYIVKVLDFGLAKLRDTSGDTSTADEAETGPGVEAAGRRSGNAATRVNFNHTNTTRAAQSTQSGADKTNAGGPRPAAPAQTPADPEAATRIQAPVTAFGEEATRIQLAEDATRIQPLPAHAEAGEADEAATMIQPAATAVAENTADEAATILQPAAAAETSEEEAATRIQPAANTQAIRGAGQEVEDEGATRIQPLAGSSGNGPAPPSPSSSSASGGSQGLSGGATRPATIRDSLSPRTTGGGVTSSSSVELTRVGSILGTPLYMSPEQCKGDALDARSDIYSLGVIIYQMLTGETPFSGNMTELMTKHCDAAPPSLQDKRGNVPEAITRLVMSSLAKDPEARPATAEGFATALRATAETEPELLRQSKSFYYSAQRQFFVLSLVTYAPFALISMIVSLSLNRLLSTSPAAAVAFYAFLYALILFGTRFNTAACTLILKEMRLSQTTAVATKAVLKAYLSRLPKLLPTVALVYVKTLLAPLRLRSPLKAHLAYSLAAPSVAIEGKSGGAALSHSERLVGPMRALVRGVMARDFGISLISIVGFPSVMTIMGIIFGGASVGVLAFMMLPVTRNFTAEYCWFILLLMHTVYSAMPLAMLYFKARQASGEQLDESVADDWQPVDLKKRTDKMTKATLGWFIAPIVLIAATTVAAFLGLKVGSASLVDAVIQGRRAEVRQLLAAGANPNAGRIGNRTPLMYAAKDGRVGFIKDLLQAGAGLEERDSDGDTALIYAAIDNRVEAVQTLLAAGANKEARNNNQRTALIFAAQKGRAETVQALLDAGADPAAKDTFGKTAQAYAEEEGYGEIAQMLKEVLKESRVKE